MKQKMSKQIRRSVIALLCVVSPCLVQAGSDFAPPTISLVDKLGVNLANGQISQSLNTVSIGGEMGLSHSISAYTNEFSMTGYRGYMDKFDAITRPKVIGMNVQDYGFLNVLNVHDFENSVDFIVKVNNQRVSVYEPVPQGSTYTYEALGDERHTLKVGADGYLNWTKPNGTVVRFSRSVGAQPSDSGFLDQIIYPNGFTIDVGNIPTSTVNNTFYTGVSTNTGFQLKYTYVEDNSSSSSSSSASNMLPAPQDLSMSQVQNCAYLGTWKKVDGATSYTFREYKGTETSIPVPSTNPDYLSKSVYCAYGAETNNRPEWVRACNGDMCSEKAYFPGMKPDPIGTAINIPPADPLNWSRRNPKYIQAINVAVEDCGIGRADCSLPWPKATFTWPAGMPRAMYYGQPVFKVTDAVGNDTSFRFKAYDLAYSDSGVQIPGETPGRRWSVRLVNIKSASSRQEELTYDYKNLTNPVSYFAGSTSWIALVQEAGVIKSASKIDNSAGYRIGEKYYTDFVNQGSLSAGVSSVTLRNVYPGTLIDADTTKGKLHYEVGFRNFVDSFTPLLGEKETYTYTRGNLTKITYSDGVAEAEYPASCDSNNYKYCNQPKWTSDKKGKKTYYEYNTYGQVIRLTLPPSVDGGISGVTRYGYQTKSANFYKNGSLVAGSPISLKVSEKTCIKTATVGDACAGGSNDEIVTTYEYENKNLFLVGIVVTAVNSMGQLEPHRTCYQYDRYGNRIGETQPKGNASRLSCLP